MAVPLRDDAELCLAGRSQLKFGTELDWCVMTLRCSKSIKVQYFAETTHLVDFSNFSYYISVVSYSIPHDWATKKCEFPCRWCNKSLIYRLTVAEILQSLLASKGWYLKYLLILPGERIRRILVESLWASLGLLNTIYGNVMSNTIITKAQTVAW